MMLSGSLGIGTTTVGSKLVVQGASNASTTSSLNVTGSDGGSHLFVRDDGNIGVGTSNPLFKLEVAGTASTTALNVVGNINNATLTANSLVITDANKNLASSGIVVNNIISSVATGTAGNIFNISTTTNSLTINLPFANINNTGQLQAADWLTFNNKLSGSLTRYLPKATGASTSQSLVYDTVRMWGLGQRHRLVNYM